MSQETKGVLVIMLAALLIFIFFDLIFIVAQYCGLDVQMRAMFRPQG